LEKQSFTQEQSISILSIPLPHFILQEALLGHVQYQAESGGSKHVQEILSALKPFGHSFKHWFL